MSKKEKAKKGDPISSTQDGPASQKASQKEDPISSTQDGPASQKASQKENPTSSTQDGPDSILTSQDMQSALGSIIDESFDTLKLGIRWCFIAKPRDT